MWDITFQYKLRKLVNQLRLRIQSSMIFTQIKALNGILLAMFFITTSRPSHFCVGMFCHGNVMFYGRRRYQGAFTQRAVSDTGPSVVQLISY